ncbi:hypothetical protein, partial [Burkholderia pseudomallei]|uniref:hypothetical protein n=1 Tax=Burkholderia pseudomallei TaxID=28450 RepID=UPI000CCF7F73
AVLLLGFSVWSRLGPVVRTNAVRTRTSTVAIHGRALGKEASVACMLCVAEVSFVVTRFSNRLAVYRAQIIRCVVAISQSLWNAVDVTLPRQLANSLRAMAKEITRRYTGTVVAADYAVKRQFT